MDLTFPNALYPAAMPDELVWIYFLSAMGVWVLACGGIGVWASKLLALALALPLAIVCVAASVFVAMFHLILTGAA